MIRETGEAIIELLEDEFNFIEFYNGQFERFDEETINPPHAYLDYQSGTATEINGEVLNTIDLTLFAMTSSLDRDPGNMLDLLESIILKVHKRGLRCTATVAIPDGYLGRCFYMGFKNNTTFPGLLVWEVMLQVRR